MKKALVFCLLAGISLISNNSFGATCQAVTCPTSGGTKDTSYLIDNCLVAGSDSNGANKVCYKSASGTTTYYSFDCKTCNSGYTLKYTTGKYSSRAGCYAPVKLCVLDAGGGDDDPTCPSTCPSSTSWTSTTGNKEARCDTSSTPNSSNQYKCEYRCKAGYYNGSAIVGLTSCYACPANATCAAGQDPKCNKGYYIENTSSGGGMISGQKKCTQCPTYKTNTPGNPGTGINYGTTVSTGSDAITDCYEPKGTNHKDDTGWYEITTDQKCFYVE